MILWFGKKKKKKELEDAGAAMDAPDLSAEEVAAKDAAEKEKAEREAAEKAEIERKVAEANRAWEERQKREREEAEAETRRLETQAREAEAAREQARKAAEEASLKAAEDEAARKAAEEAEAQARRAEEEAERIRKEEAEREAARQKAENEIRIAEERRRAEAEREEARRKEDAAKAPEPPAQSVEPDPYAETKSPGFFKKLTSGLSKSSSKLGASLTGTFTRRKLDDEALEELEDLLITSDMGARVAARITTNLAKTRFDKDVTDDEIKAALAEEIEAIMKPREQVVDFSDGPTPRIVLFVGVNGSGKTTTIGKIASKLKEQGASALLVAGDTFRAAAIEQLTVWGERAGIPVMSKPTGADAAGLVYEAVEKAKAEGLDLVLVDTAGRLQNKAELMSELAKIVRVTRKLDPEAPHDVILVLDATVGQNALSQVEAFRHTAGVSGIVMTKLDGTAKGGVLVAIAEAHDLPIHFIGVGEKAEDLQPFSAEAYAKALVGMDEKEPA